MLIHTFYNIHKKFCMLACVNRRQHLLFKVTSWCSRKLHLHWSVHPSKLFATTSPLQSIAIPMFVRNPHHHYDRLLYLCWIANETPITTCSSGPSMRFTKLIKITFLLFSLSFVGAAAGLYQKLQPLAQWYLMCNCYSKEQWRNAKKCWYLSHRDYAVPGQVAPVTGEARLLWIN